MKHKLGLSIKGGMARGLGSIGLIRLLQEEDIPLTVLAGSSSGAIVASMYALGFSWEEMLDMIDDFKVIELISLQGVLQQQGVISAEKLITKIERYVADTKIEDLPLELLLFASDPKKRTRVILNKGSLFQAILASCAYPLVLPSVKINRQQLIDGDFTVSYSANCLREAGADQVIGVSYKSTKVPRDLSTNFVERAVDAYRLLTAQVEAMNDTLDPVDLEINYEAADYNYMDFQHVDKLARRAYREAKDNLAKIQRMAGVA
jgi:NTE family protein